MKTLRKKNSGQYCIAEAMGLSLEEVEFVVGHDKLMTPEEVVAHTLMAGNVIEENKDAIMLLERDGERYWVLRKNERIYDPFLGAWVNNYFAVVTKSCPLYWVVL